MPKKGFTHSQETRRRISEAMKRHYDNEEVNHGKARRSLSLKCNKNRLGIPLDDCKNSDKVRAMLRQLMTRYNNERRKKKQEA